VPLLTHIKQPKWLEIGILA